MHFVNHLKTDYEYAPNPQFKETSLRINVLGRNQHMIDGSVDPLLGCETLVFQNMVSSISYDWIHAVVARRINFYKRIQEQTIVPTIVLLIHHTIQTSSQ